MTSHRIAPALVAALLVPSLGACAASYPRLAESCIELERTVDDPAAPAGTRSYRLSGATFDACSIDEGRYACQLGTTDSDLGGSFVILTLDLRAPALALDPSVQWFEANGDLYYACVEVSPGEHLATEACRDPGSATGCGSAERELFESVRDGLQECAADAACRHTVTFAD